MAGRAVGHRLVLDIQALQSPSHSDRGIGRYVRDHATALLSAGAPVASLALNPMLPAPELGELGKGPVAWNTPSLVRDASLDGPVAYHVMSPFEDTRPVDGVVAPHALLGADALVVTLYDTIPFAMPDEYQRGWWARQFLRRRARLVETADLVLAISESTARDAVDMLHVDPDRVAVIGGAASPFFRPEEPADGSAELLERSLPSITRPYVMTVSGDDPRKDPETLISAFARLPRTLRDAHQLVIACTITPGAAAKWSDFARSSGLPDDALVLTGYVDDSVLRALYQRASLFAFTSRYEGFGLPVLEAACCGAPVVTASSSSLPEILDLPESTFPPGDADACAALVARALTDGGLRSDLLDAGARAARRHTWQAVAERTIDALATLSPSRTAPSGPVRRAPATSLLRRAISRPRVALVGPFPPARSGVADYNARVAAELATVVDLTVFTEDTLRPAGDGRLFRTLPALAFGRSFHPGSFDHIVYTLGNSHHHRRTFDLALRYPGIVWLHDASLAGLYLTRAGLYLPGVDPETIDFDRARVEMRAAVERNAGAGTPDLGDGWWRPEAYVRAGLTMTEEVLRTARAVLVNTDAARDLIGAHTPEGVPVAVLPLASQPSPPAATAPDIDDDGAAPWVVSLGVVSTAKRAEHLVRAAAHILATTPVRLALVGDVDPQYRDELLTLADDLGAGGSVVVTGFVDDAQYRSWIARASLVVQLRQHSQGEGSAAVADALAAGKAVLTSVASAAELPPGVVEILDADADVESLAARITGLLGDEALRASLGDSARRHAQSWTFAQVAQGILGVLSAAARPAFPEPLFALR